jgi:uncharacterized protein YbbK (DUF523 family)
MKQRILVSACLLGRACRYDGRAKPNAAVQSLTEQYEVIPVCPESFGGLTIPRPPSEQRDGGVYSQSGEDVTAAFVRGADMTLRIAREQGATFAVLKARSPSCGKDFIYDGTFSGTLIPGQGIAAARLMENGIAVYTEEELELLPNREETKEV